MPQSKGSKLYNQFVAGLVTEATALTYPENASFDEQNFELLRKGSRRRRRGIKKSDTPESISFATGSINAADVRDGQIAYFKWNSAGGLGINNFYIVQVGDKLLVWDNANYLETIDLSVYATDSDNLPKYKCQFASGRGFLFVVNPYMESIYIKYDTDTETFTVVQIDIKIRDLQGVDDGLLVDERPTSLSDEHYYNLLNQGWISSAVSSLNAVHPIKDFYDYSTSTGVSYPTKVYPSNADIIYYGKIQAASTETQIGKYRGDEVFKTHYGSTPAAKGHYILNAFDINRSAAVQSSDLNNNSGGIYGTSPVIDTVTVSQRPRNVAFYAGRVWWSGINDNEYAGTLLGSQLIESESDIGKCYQINDPTSEDLSDIIDTDGVVIPIAEAGEILKLVPINDNLIIFATNGVWSLSGIDGSFTATGYSIRKISSTGAITGDSIIEVENSIIYWGTSGIFALSPDNVTGYLTPNNLSIGTIQSFYDELPAVAKFQVSSLYDTKEKRVLWYYSTENTATLSDSSWGTGLYKGWYDKVLVFDTALKAFSKWSIPSPSDEYPVFVAGGFMENINGRSEVIEDVQANSDNVEVSGVQVVVTEYQDLIADVEHILLTIDGEAEEIGFSTYSNDTDFNDFDGWSQSAEAAAYLETGAMVGDTIANDMQTMYVVIASNRTELTYTVSSGIGSWNNPSGVKVRAKWDWFDQNNGRWSSQWDAYKLEGNFNFDDSSDGNKAYTGGQTVVITKNKLRGRGYALQLRFDVDSGKDCQLLGWQVIGEQRTAV